MLDALKHVSTLYHVMTLSNYLSFLGIPPQQHIANFLEETIICSLQNSLQKFNNCPPWSFFFQKATEQWKKNETHVNQLGFIDPNKNCKYIVCSRKLLYSNEMEELFKVIGTQNMDFLLNNFIILVKDGPNSNYIQICGEPIMTPSRKFSKQMKLEREKIFYCNHQSRNAGLFKKNFLSQAKKQIQSYTRQKLVENNHICIKASSNILAQLKQKASLSNREEASLRPHLEAMCQNLLTYQFHTLLKYLAPLPPSYQQLKEQVKQGNSPKLFDDLYSHYVEYERVVKLISKLVYDIVPESLLGKDNLEGFVGVLRDFIIMKRYEDQTYLDYMCKMNVFSIPWMDSFYQAKYKSKLIFYKRKKLHRLLEFLFHDLIIPFIRHNFYVTERMQDDSKIFYYRKEIWTLISKLSIQSLVSENFASIQRTQINSQYIGKLRIKPKPGSFRPITTYKRRGKISGKSLSYKLMETKLILRNLKTAGMGYSVFDSSQVFYRLAEFSKFWNAQGRPKLYFQVVDITKCYDSIDLSLLYRFLQESKLFSFSYAINRYALIQRNNKELKRYPKMKNLFHYSERSCAIPLDNVEALSRGYVEHLDKIRPSIVINGTVSNQLTFFEVLQNIKDVCQNNIIQFKNNFYVQKVGIPQGLNISGVLCSFYLSCIEKKFIQYSINQSLVMRLTDDYFFASMQLKFIEQSLEKLEQMEKQYNMKFNKQKFQTNLKGDQPIKWIGKYIHEDLTIKPALKMESRDQIYYSVNVNFPKYTKLSYLYNKLKSLILNQLKYYCNEHLNPLKTQIKIIKQFLRLGVLKFVYFVQESRKHHLKKSAITRILITITSDLAYYCTNRLNSQISYDKIKLIIRKTIVRTIRGDKVAKKLIPYGKI